jgi:L-asparaginase II
MSESTSSNPVLVEIVRGSLVESRHTGAIAVADAGGRLVLALGDVECPIYPRSAVKAMQALPLIESGAADAFALSEGELAVACASHSGDRVHLDAVRSLLAKAGLDESTLACGAHWPVSEEATRELMRARQRPRAIHNNCSGKHAAMLGTAKHLGLDPRGYEQPDHPVQSMIARIISETCGVALDRTRMGIDGCSVPTFALPLASLATGFARLGSGVGLPSERASAARRLLHACFAEPLHVAGEGRFDTIVLRGLAPSCFVKCGAVGVHCAALPKLGLGIALKIDDGAKRAAELVMSELLAALLPEARQVLADQLAGEIQNWKGVVVGRVAPSELLRQAVAASPLPSGIGE